MAVRAKPPTPDKVQIDEIVRWLQSMRQAIGKKLAAVVGTSSKPQSEPQAPHLPHLTPEQRQAMHDDHANDPGVREALTEARAALAQMHRKASGEGGI